MSKVEQDGHKQVTAQDYTDLSAKVAQVASYRGKSYAAKTFAVGTEVKSATIQEMLNIFKGITDGYVVKQVDNVPRYGDYGEGTGLLRQDGKEGRPEEKYIDSSPRLSEIKDITYYTTLSNLLVSTNQQIATGYTGCNGNCNGLCTGCVGTCIGGCLGSCTSCRGCSGCSGCTSACGRDTCSGGCGGCADVHAVCGGAGQSDYCPSCGNFPTGWPR